MDFLYQIGKFLLFSLLSELVRPKTKRTGPAAGGLKDLSFPTVDPTRPHQWLIGRRVIDNANLFGTWDFKAVERSKKVRTGIFSKERIPLPPVYYVSSAMVLCGGTGARLKRIYLGDRVLWSGDLASGGAVNVNVSWNEEGQEDYPRGLIARIEFHSGSTTPNAYIQAKQGVANTPSFKHLTYVVVRGQDGSAQPGAWIGTNKTVEHLKFEVEKMPTAASTGLGAHPDGGNYWTVDGDANPAYAVAELMVDRNYGAGEPADTLNAAVIHASAKQLHTEGHGTSQLWDSQRATGDVILELCRQVGGVLLPEPLFGLQEFRLLRAEDVPLLVLNDDNIVRLDTFSRSAMSEATNTLSLEYVAKDEKYDKRPVEVQDLAAIDAAGQVITGQTAYSGIMNPNIALSVGMRDLRALSAPLAAARLTAIVPKNQRLFPGDPVLFSSPANGVAQLRMRVTSSRYSKPGVAACELELIEDVFFSGEAVYAIPPAATGGTGSGTTALPGRVLTLSARHILSPFALTGDNADHPLFFASAPDASTTGYRLGFGSDPADLEFFERSLGFSATGTLSSALADVAAPGSVSVAINAANAAVLRAYGSQSLYAIFERDLFTGTSNLRPEWVKVSSVSVNTAGTVATLTGLTRGCFDTLPYARNVGDTVHLLCDFAVDPRPLQSTVFSAPGTVFQTYPGDPAAGAYAYGSNVRGLSAASSVIGLDTGTSGGGAGINPPGSVRAALPLPPGNVRLAGQTGASTTGAAPSVAVGSTFAVTWTPRQRATSGDNPWSQTTGTADAGVAFDVQLQRWTGSFWTTDSSVRTAAGATTVTMAKPSGGGLVRVFLSPVIPVGANGVSGTPQEWIFNLT